MKKIALTSLLAVAMASAAHASVNVIDGNPLYMPTKGHFYSETSLSSNTNNVDEWALGENFGYGILDNLAVSVKTSFSESYWFKGMKGYQRASTQRPYDGNGNAWNELGADITWRVIGDKAWKLDVMGGFEMDPVWGDHIPFLDKDYTLYTWTAGVRGGYVTNDWTLSAHANFIYMNTEAFNWGDDDAKYIDKYGKESEYWANHTLNFGVAGHWTMSDTWSVIAALDYYKIMDRYNEAVTMDRIKSTTSKGYWDLTLGLNMNIDPTKYIGAYVTKTMRRGNDGYLDVSDGLSWEYGSRFYGGYGYKFGLKFGIDF